MKLTRLMLALTLAASSSASYAATNIFPAGSNLGYGDASNTNTVYSVTANPAWLGSNLHNENNYGLGISAGVMLKQQYLQEIGDGFSDNISPILEQMDNNQNTALVLAEDLKAEVNGLVLDTRDNFQVNLDTNFSVPIVVTNSHIGGIGIEISGLMQTQERLLSSNKPIELDTAYLLANQNATTEDIINNGLIVQTAFYTKTATYAEAALTYGNQFYSNEHGILSVGAKLKYMQARFRKSINDLDTYLKAIANDDDIETLLQEDLNELNDGDFESAIGVDLGAMWIAPNWYAGVTMMNVNSPSFKYNTLGTGTTNQDYVEQYYRTQINLNEEVVFVPQGRLEAAVYSQNRYWTLAGAYDTNEAYDLMNNAYQWASVSASFATDAGNAWWWILVPDVRLGYRTNLVGDQQSYITPGFTFGPLNIDLAFSPSAISDAQNGDIPESFAINAGLEILF